MLHAMTDPKRHILKTHGVKNELAPDIGVDPNVFFVLGRLVGKAIAKNAGLPFAFHPRWIQILKEPQDKDFIEECFPEVYQDELRMIDSLLTYTKGEVFDDIWDCKLASPSEWYSTNENSILNYIVYGLHDTNQYEPKEVFQPRTDQDIIDFVKIAKE